MTPDFRQRFPRVPEHAWPRLEAWAALLRAWNARVNLISRREIDRLEERHLAPCLAATQFLRLMPGARVLDAGTGGGLPGLPLAICYPEASFALADSVGKKIGAVRDMAERLELKNVRAVQTRVEDMSRAFDFVTGRAVKNLPEFLGWVAPRVRRGRRHNPANGVLYWKGGDWETEIARTGIRPRRVVDLETELNDPAFAEKHILHVDARDLPRLKTKGKRRG